MMTGSVDILKSNCSEYARASKGIAVLKLANGKNHYTRIAKLIGIHQTKVSSLLKKAEKLGLAQKIKAGIYKKVPGILGYMPPKRKIEAGSSKNIKDLIKKIIKNKTVRAKSQAPSSLAIPNKIEANLGKMANAYQALYAVENTMRELIRKELGSKTDWWKNYVPAGIKKDVEDVIKKQPYHATKRNDELEYTHLGQLKEIVIYKKNWNGFLTYLNEKDKNAFAATVNKAIPSRNAIGHCIPLKSKDLKVVDVRFEDILTMVK